jgi:hypothetical protein
MLLIAQQPILSKLTFTSTPKNMSNQLPLQIVKFLACLLPLIQNILVTTVGRRGTLLKIVSIHDKVTPTLQSHQGIILRVRTRVHLRAMQRKDNRKTGRVFYTQVYVTPKGHPVLMGTFSVAHHPAKVLLILCISYISQ